MVSSPPPLETASSPERSLTLAVVGDVHDQWTLEDNRALQKLGVDLVLLVGDFGNEAVEVVQRVAQLALPKAVVLGNHDAWYSATSWGRQKCPYDRTLEDRVQQQLDLLGDCHVGYGVLNLPHLGVSVVGSRPFSWGGPDWRNKTFYRERFGVQSFAESTAKIVAAAQSATESILIFLGHCGPAGLGDRPDDPCGRDWSPPGGDYGDPDFAAAIAQSQSLEKPVPLVAFGHMHHTLRHTRHPRKRLTVDGATVYLNAASVPRIVSHPSGQRRNFSLVTLTGAQVTRAALVWVDDSDRIAEEEVLYDLQSSTPQTSLSSC